MTSIMSMYKACCVFDGMLSGVQNNAGKTFQVLKTWKVYRS